MANGKKLIDKLERLIFGATAQEMVEMRVRLAEQRLETRLIAVLEAGEDEDGDTDDDTEQHDVAGTFVSDRTLSRGHRLLK